MRGRFLMRHSCTNDNNSKMRSPFRNHVFPNQLPPHPPSAPSPPEKARGEKALDTKGCRVLQGCEKCGRGVGRRGDRKLRVRRTESDSTGNPGNLRTRQPSNTATKQPARPRKRPNHITFTRV